MAQSTSSVMLQEGLIRLSPAAERVYNNHGTPSPPVPTLAPELANYYRRDLLQHAVAWPTEKLEKQIRQLEDDAYQSGCMRFSTVAAELKIAHAKIRHWDIKSTHVEAKLMYMKKRRNAVYEFPKKSMQQNGTGVETEPNKPEEPPT